MFTLFTKSRLRIPRQRIGRRLSEPGVRHHRTRSRTRVLPGADGIKELATHLRAHAVAGISRLSTAAGFCRSGCLFAHQLEWLGSADEGSGHVRLWTSGLRNQFPQVTALTN